MKRRGMDRYHCPLPFHCCATRDVDLAVAMLTGLVCVLIATVATKLRGLWRSSAAA
jgi:hypothetical protein